MREKRHPLFQLWASMRCRCNNPKRHNYKYYGGRGIRVCERWGSLANFVADMGERPPGHTLDRIDNDGDYCPENCRWVPHIVQTNNARSNRKLFHNGESINLAQAARKYGIQSGTIAARLKYGWSMEQALTIPVGSTRNRPPNYYATERANRI